jgi:hypothetical protein
VAQAVDDRFGFEGRGGNDEYAQAISWKSSDGAG